MVEGMIERIKEAVSIEEALRHFGVEVPERGRDPVMVRCPWHEDRSPSMAVYRREGRAWCFSCQRGGDVLDVTSAFVGGGIGVALGYWAERLGLPGRKGFDPDEAVRLRLRAIRDRERKRVREIARRASLLAEQGLRPGSPSEIFLYDAIYEVKDELDRGLSSVDDPESLYAYIRRIVSWRRWAEEVLNGTVGRPSVLRRFGESAHVGKLAGNSEDDEKSCGR